MTIRKFAQLCRCNPQTLRYYDNVNLLKPVKVDPYSGYRFYEEEQALDFVKIKNLQSAGFTIGEIKELLDQDNDAIYEAFNKKIEEQEERLQQIRRIQRSYQNEMNQMKQRIEGVREEVFRAMQAYDPEEEFGIDPAEYNSIVGNVSELFESILANSSRLEYAAEELEDSGEKFDRAALLNDPAYEVVYEKHGWRHVKDFLEDWAELENGAEYALYFEAAGEKTDQHLAFANTILGVLLNRNQGKKINLGCNVNTSPDGQNHFWLLKTKP